MMHSKTKTCSTGTFTLAELMVLLVVAVVIVVVVVAHWPDRSHPHGPRDRCAGNLKQLGLGLLMYSGDNDGYFPNLLPNTPPHNNFGVLVTTNYLQDGKVWACPARSVVHTMGVNSAYRYIGSGILDDDANATTTSLAYDEKGNHPPTEPWMNVIFVDGHVEGAKPGKTRAGIYFQNN